MRAEIAVERALEKPETNLRVLLAAFWISHFLLWTFGDMAALLQESTEPVLNNLLLFVAVPLAIVQALMIVFSLTGRAGLVRWANIGFAVVFLLANIGFLVDSGEAWEYLLGAAYILFNVLIIWNAWRWTTQETDSQPATS